MELWHGRTCVGGSCEEVVGRTHVPGPVGTALLYGRGKEIRSQSEGSLRTDGITKEDPEQSPRPDQTGLVVPEAVPGH